MKKELQKKKSYLGEKVMIAMKNAIKKEVKVINSDDSFSLVLDAAIVGCAAFIAYVYISVGVEDPDKDVARLFRKAADQLEKKGGGE